MSLSGESDKRVVDPTTNKVVLVGDETVGKTSMFLRFKTDRFIETTSSTRYLAEHYKEWTVRGTKVQMTLYDTAGMERYTSTIPPTYFRHARAVILVYAVDNEDSIGNISNWSESFSKHRIGDTVDSLKVLLVGNKVDLNRTVSANRVNEVAEFCGIDNSLKYEISTKNNDGGFDGLFDDLAYLLSDTPIERRKTIRATSSPDDEEMKKKKALCSKCS